MANNIFQIIPWKVISILSVIQTCLGIFGTLGMIISVYLNVDWTPPTHWFYTGFELYFAITGFMGLLGK